MSCAGGKCSQKCGQGLANPKPPNDKDPVYRTLCEITCRVRKEFCEGRHKNKLRGQVVEEEAAKSKKLKEVLGSRSGLVNKQRLVKYPGMPKSWGRMKVDPAQLARQLDKMEAQFTKLVKKKLTAKAAQKLATAWTRFVPVVGWGMAAYDAYDIVTTGKKIYDDWDRIKNTFTGDDVYRIRPDVAVTDGNGRLDDIYDFKMDNPDSGFEDDWNDGQKEMYDKALSDDGSSKTSKVVDAEKCGCDLPKGAKVMPGYAGAGV